MNEAGRVQTVVEAVARLVELDVPESALTPLRQWIKENTFPLPPMDRDELTEFFDV